MALTKVGVSPAFVRDFIRTGIKNIEYGTIAYVLTYYKFV